MPLPWPASLLPEAPILALVAAARRRRCSARTSATGSRAPGARAAARCSRPRRSRSSASASRSRCAPSEGDADPRRGHARRRSGPAPDREVIATHRGSTRRARPTTRSGCTRWPGRAAAAGSSSSTRSRRAPTGRPSRSRCTATGRRWSACTPARHPRDARLPARATRASRRARCRREPRFERAFQLDSEVLRREERGGAAWLSGAAYGILAASRSPGWRRSSPRSRASSGERARGRGQHGRVTPAPPRRG